MSVTEEAPNSMHLEMVTPPLISAPTLLTSNARRGHAESGLKHVDAGIGGDQVQQVEEEGDGSEKDLSPKARQAKEKSARDEVFWMAAQQALCERERRERVRDFLKEHGFASVEKKKQGWWSYTYPLHRAAELGDVHLVQLLLESGAMRRQRNSSGQTARQAAKNLNQQGSHNEVIQLLKLCKENRCQAYPQTRTILHPTSSASMSTQCEPSPTVLGHEICTE